MKRGDEAERLTGSMKLTPEILHAALTAPREPFLAHTVTFPTPPKDAAVVVPVRVAPQPTALLILRAAGLREHPGEVAFPGGKPEPGDDGLWSTAVREMKEEIGLGPEDIDIERVGTLAPALVKNGRYRIHPFVVALRDGAAPRAASPEIERLLEVPLLPWITGERPILGVRLNVQNISFVAPQFELDGCVLFGATAVIFQELLLRVAAALQMTHAPVVVQEALNLYESAAK